MDNRRFDDLTRSLASRGSRRGFLRRLLGLGTGVAAASVLIEPADAARRGFSGPRFPWFPDPVEPSACEPFCSVGMCGVPNGCGGMCTCDSPRNCVFGACTKPCGSPPCDYCLTDGGISGCFTMMFVPCSDDTDCEAQFGSGVCRAAESGTHYCFVPQ